MIDGNKEMLPFVSRTKRIQARQIAEQSEMIDCYNGMRVGVKGDWIVVTEEGRTMLMGREKFFAKFITEEYRAR